MRRYAPVCLLAALSAACADLTPPPSPPPVALSVLSGPVEGAAADTPHASTASQVRLLRAVPPRALLTIHLPDLAGAIDRFEKTGLYRWLSSPEIAEHFGGGTSFQLTLPGLAGPAGTAAPNLAQLKRALRGELIVSIDSIDPGAHNPLESFRLIAGVTVPGAARQAEEMLALADMIAAGQDGVHVEKGTVGGQAYSRIVGKDPVPWVVELALFEDAVLAGFGRETVTAALERLQNDELPSLAEEPGFEEPMKRCADPRDALRIHLALGTILDRLSPLVPRDFDRVLKALGLNHLRSLNLAVRFDGSDIVVSNHLDSPGGKDAVTQLLAAHTVDLSFLERLPPDTSSFSLFALDGRRLIQTARSALPDGARRDLEESLAGLRESGIDVETAVFDVFGPRCALVNVPTDRPDGPGLEAIWGQLLGTALVCEVQDPVRAKEILDRLPERGALTTRRALLVEGVPAFAYRFETDQLPADLSICYAMTDGYLVVAASEAAFKRMLRRRSPQTTERFREMLAEVPVNAVIVTYDDLRRGPGIFLDSVLQGLPGTRPLPGELRRQRPSTSLLRELGPSLSYTLADQRGVLSVTRSPTGGFGSLGGLGGLLMMAAIAVPNIQHARVETNETAAVATMRAIHTAQETFRSNALRDEDGDGDGEFGFLSELLGQPRPGEKRARAATPLVSGAFQTQDGDFVRGGYRFRVYLPAEDGSPIGEHESTGRIRRVDGDLAETVMVVIGWPVSKGLSGRRSFLLDGQGRLFACLDGPYAGGTAPPSDILSAQEGNLASRPVRETEATRDGCRWVRVR